MIVLKSRGHILNVYIYMYTNSWIQLKRDLVSPVFKRVEPIRWKYKYTFH
jgi:hypothetical protein